MPEQKLEEKEWFRAFKYIYIALSVYAIYSCISLWKQDDPALEYKPALSDYLIYCDNGKEINVEAVGIDSKSETDLTNDEDIRVRKLCRCGDEILDFILEQRNNEIDDGTILSLLTGKFQNNDQVFVYEHLRHKEKNPSVLVDALVNNAIANIEVPAVRNYVIKKNVFRKANIKYIAIRWGATLFGALIIGWLLYLFFKAIKKILTLVSTYLDETFGTNEKKYGKDDKSVREAEAKLKETEIVIQRQKAIKGNKLTLKIASILFIVGIIMATLAINVFPEGGYFILIFYPGCFIVITSIVLLYISAKMHLTLKRCPECRTEKSVILVNNAQSGFYQCAICKAEFGKPR